METVGSLIDKITILNLKIYHMTEQVRSKVYDEKHCENCQEKLAILNNQRNDLVVELDSLITDIKAGKRSIKVSRQFKMYNDSIYKLPT
jgi:hypothetical protein